MVWTDSLVLFYLKMTFLLERCAKEIKIDVGDQSTVSDYIGQNRFRNDNVHTGLGITNHALKCSIFKTSFSLFMIKSQYFGQEDELELCLVRVLRNRKLWTKHSELLICTRLRTSMFCVYLSTTACYFNLLVMNISS